MMLNTSGLVVLNFRNMILTKIKKELFFIKTRRIANAINEHNSSDSLLAKLLWNLIREKTSLNLISAIKEDDRFTHLKHIFSDWWRAYISDLEVINSNYFVESDSSAQRTSILSEEEYVPLTEELDAMNVDFSNKKFLMVGSGPFPETLFFICNHYKVSETFGLDSNQEAIKNAEKVLQIMSPNNKIKLINSTAQNFDFSCTDIVFMANGLRNKEDTLDQVYTTSPDNINVILRNPINLAGLLYEDVNDYLSKSNKWIVTKRYKSSILGETILIKKCTNLTL